VRRRARAVTEQDATPTFHVQPAVNPLAPPPYSELDTSCMPLTHNYVPAAAHYSAMGGDTVSAGLYPIIRRTASMMCENEVLPSEHHLKA